MAEERILIVAVVAVVVAWAIWQLAPDLSALLKRWRRDDGR